MARIVGDSKFYTFHLKMGNGRYSQDVTISLPSVTSIIHNTYAAPALQGWNYRQTRDSIAGAISELSSGFDGTDESLGNSAFRDMIEEVFGDGDNLDLFLKENRLRPEDISKEAMKRGSEEHEYLAGLGDAYKTEGPEAAVALAEKLLSNTSSSPWGRAIADWWLTRTPRVVASEHTVFALEPHGGYAGSLDLVYDTWDDLKMAYEPLQRPERVLCDLKTRKAGADRYTSDEIQVGAYQLAWEAQTNQPIQRRTILVAREDATWDEYTANTPPDTFLHLLAISSLINGKE